LNHSPVETPGGVQIDPHERYLLVNLQNQQTDAYVNFEKQKDEGESEALTW
jgi:hypothetical protein